MLYHDFESSGHGKSFVHTPGRFLMSFQGFTLEKNRKLENIEKSLKKSHFDPMFKITQKTISDAQN